MEFQEITYVRVIAPSALALKFADGEEAEIDFSPWIGKGGVFSPMSDPKFFSQVAIGDRGRYLAWPGEIAVCPWNGMSYSASNTFAALDNAAAGSPDAKASVVRVICVRK